MPRIAVAPTISMPEDVRLGRPNDYLESLRRTGAEIRVLDYARDDPAQVLVQVDGVMLLGGHDVDPALYGEAAHETFEASSPGRDAFEIALTRGALERQMPLFAICRGLQVMNVALGGTLVQDIPTQIAAAGVEHAVKVPKDRLAHVVSVTRGSRLESVLGSIEVDVNSRHHQAVKALGEDLIATATAIDGVIEAAEHAGLPFFLGVQWHPENFWETGRFQPLFDAFVRAAGQGRL